jgi:hypothetical protein
MLMDRGQSNMTDAKARSTAKEFIAYWTGKGYEKGESQPFWLSLLSKVFGVENPEQCIIFEDQVMLDHTSFIDGKIESTHVLIEQKGVDKDLRKPIRQADGSLLNPFQQAKRYAAELPYSHRPRWIVTCNFKSFLIYDMETPSGAPEEILLNNLEKEYYRLNFLVDTGDDNIKKEMEISIQAGRLVGLLYEDILKQYYNPENEHSLKSLNKLCVRLVFCLYAEDAGVFGQHLMFHNYLRQFQPKDVRRALIELFRVLNTEPEARDPYLEPSLAAFPYVNGDLFADDEIEIPQFNQTIVNLLLKNASEDFDWSEISPTIFGAVFESTLNPDTRRSGGMHYTSIENIHKVIDPLFLDDLKKELEAVKAVAVLRTHVQKLEDFQEKLAGFAFLDPACGSGNFLTETYLSLRKLENEVIRCLIDAQKGQAAGQIMFGDSVHNPIRVSIGQFYGIEINDFAVAVAKTALWIAQSQMLKQTEDIVHLRIDFLPLKSYPNIHEANALRIDWETVVPKHRLNYIMGNPPFVGFKFADFKQKEAMQLVFRKDIKPALLDYVCCWFKKASEYIHDTSCEVAFVSTNSITQGKMAGDLWTLLFNKCQIVINFAWRSFVWENESSNKAHVHVVIVGFAFVERYTKYIYTQLGRQKVGHINPYLVEGTNVLIISRNTPLCNVPEIVMGNQAMDGGNLIIEAEEYTDLLSREPDAAPYIKRYMMGNEFINNKLRWCLWLVGCSPSQLRRMPLVMKRVQAVQQMRAISNDAGARSKAETPMLFREQRNPDRFIAIPITSSENRRYIPIGFLDNNVIAGNTLFIVEEAQIYHFGILMSNVHMSWMRVIGARMKSDYRYSKDIVYNNFPWPNPTDKQKAEIEQSAQSILDARALYPDSSLADLYDEVTMPPELRKAHQNNDRAVMQAYGFSVKMSESECVAELMKLYQKLVAQKQA